MKEYFHILKQVKLFDDIDSNDLNSMLHCLGAKTKKYNKNSIVCLAGDNINSIGIVLSGTLDIVKEDICGNRSLISRISTSHLFGEAFVCAEIKKSPVTIYSATKSEIMYINFKKLITSCRNSCTFHNRLIQNMLKIIAKKNLMLTEKLDYLGKKSTKEKIASYLINQLALQQKSTITIPYNRNELADYLNVNRSALSRELSKMRDEKLIEFQKNKFTILNVEKLNNLDIKK